MKVISRTEWTAQYPNVSTGTEDMDGPAWFRDKDIQGISLLIPEDPLLFVELNPYAYFDSLRKSDFTARGFGDIQYNLGVAPNVEGVFCLRGLCNKSAAHRNKALNSTHVSVLVLLGSEEPPTDLLLKNLIACRDLIQSKYKTATDIQSSLPVGDFWDMETPNRTQFVNQLPNVFSDTVGVHVFELIEHLAFWGYYKGRNDGVYGNVTTNAVASLQADLRDAKLYLKRVDGNYGRYTREAFGLYLRQL
jgi:hypothetical protein